MLEEVERRLVRVAPHFQESPAGQRARFRAAEALEKFDASLRIGATGRLGADEHQPGRVSRMTHHAASDARPRARMLGPADDLRAS